MRLLKAIAVVAAIGGADGALAAGANLVQNGDFENGTTGTVLNNPYTDIPLDGNLANWSGGSNFSALYAAGTADSVGALLVPCCDYGGGIYLALWGPNNPFVGPTNNGLGPTSPDGGNFLALNADPTNAHPLVQTISGLTVGDTYKLSFYYAASLYMGYNSVEGWTGFFNGETQTGFEVTIGGQTFTTPQLFVPDHGFSGWMVGSYVFTAEATSQLLSFLAQSPNYGLPPVALLDGVSIVSDSNWPPPPPIPEPASWTLLIAGFAGVGYVGFRSARRKAAAAASEAPAARP